MLPPAVVNCAVLLVLRCPVVLMRSWQQIAKKKAIASD